MDNNIAEIHAYADVCNNSNEDWVNIQLKLIATELQIVKKPDLQEIQQLKFQQHQQQSQFGQQKQKQVINQMQN